MPVRAVVVLLGLLAITGSARADPTAVRVLRWRAPDGCPDRAHVQRTIEHWLAQSADPVDASSLGVDAVVSWSDGSWQLDLSLESPSGRARNQLTAAACETLVDVLALKVALAASAAAAQGPQRAYSPERAPVPRWLLRTAAGARIGQLPETSASFQVVGALALRVLRFEVGASYVPPRTAPRAEPFADVGAHVQAWAGLLRGCMVGRLAELEVPVCLGVELGTLRAAGFGSSQRETWSLLFGAATFGPALRWGITRTLGVWFEVNAALAFARPTFSVFDSGTRQSLPLYRPGLVAGTAMLGVEFAF